MNTLHRAGRAWRTAVLVAAFALAGLSLAKSPEDRIHPDLQNALDQANKAGRTLLVDFYGGWCPWCVKMDETLGDAGVQTQLNKDFFYYKLDVGRFDQHKECIGQYGVDGIPCLIAFTSDGAVLEKHSGYMPAADFKEFLNGLVQRRALMAKGIHPDLQPALDQANKAGRTLLVDFYGGWCPWCVKMDETLADADVQAQLNKDFFYYKLDVGRFDQHKECIVQYGVDGIPCLIAFTSDGAVLEKHSGYMPVADFKTFLTGLAQRRGSKWMTLEFAQFKGESDAVESAVAHCSRTLNRQLIVYFYADGTPEHRAVENLLASAAGDPAAAKFALLRVAQPENQALASHYGCTATPFLILFRPDGNVSTFYQAAPEREEFLTALRKAGAQN
jgi:thioredoxin-like negative regulator of GroEL